MCLYIPIVFTTVTLPEKNHGMERVLIEIFQK
jgi:hypothetical protein